MAVKRVIAQPSKSGGVEVLVTSTGPIIDEEYRFTYGSNGKLIRDEQQAARDFEKAFSGGKNAGEGN